MRKLIAFVLLACFGFMLWLVLDYPIYAGRVLHGTVLQSVYVPARTSGGYSRIVVRVENQAVITFFRSGKSQLRPGMRVTVSLRQRKYSKLISYELNQ